MYGSFRLLFHMTSFALEYADNIEV